MSKRFWTRSEPVGGTRLPTCPVRADQRRSSLRIAKGCVQFGSAVRRVLRSAGRRNGRSTDVEAPASGRWEPIDGFEFVQTFTDAEGLEYDHFRPVVTEKPLDIESTSMRYALDLLREKGWPR